MKFLLKAFTYLSCQRRTLNCWQSSWAKTRLDRAWSWFSQCFSPVNWLSILPHSMNFLCTHLVTEIRTTRYLSGCSVTTCTCWLCLNLNELCIFRGLMLNLTLPFEFWPDYLRCGWHWTQTRIDSRVTQSTAAVQVLHGVEIYTWNIHLNSEHTSSRFWR